MKSGDSSLRYRLAPLVAAWLLLLVVPVADALPNVNVMPDRQALIGTPVVVWGTTAFPNGSAFQVDFGDGTSTAIAPLSDKTYVATTHTYTQAGGGSFVATLRVWNCAPPADAPGCLSETATVRIVAVDPVVAADADRRGVKINMAIQDALRWLYVNQSDRTRTLTTSWAANRNHLAFQISYTSLAVLAFQNHGYGLPNNDDPPATIYQDVVQRGLNFIFDNLNLVNLGGQPLGDPCVGVPLDGNQCKGLGQTLHGDRGYSTAIAALAVAGSNAPARHVAAGLGGGTSAYGTGNGGFVAGRTYAEIAQRQVNTIAWAQADSGFNTGGWRYELNDNGSDGSAIGWNVLALMDAQLLSRDIVIPPFVAQALNTVLNNTFIATSAPPGGATPEAGLTYDAGNMNASTARTGIALQAFYFLGRPPDDATVQKALRYIGNRWNQQYNDWAGCLWGGTGGSTATIRGALAAGSPTGSENNKGCTYAMFNVFKGLKLYNVQTLAGVNRPAAPLGLARVGDVNDWYEDYRDFLVANQVSPSTTAGGGWSTNSMWFSCCDTDGRAITALAALMLSPTPLVLPCCLVLGTEDGGGVLSTAPVIRETGAAKTHTVTARATTAGGGATPGTTVTFAVIEGPNSGRTATVLTDDQGIARFTVTDTGGVGTDRIRATVGGLSSNTLDVTWTPADLRVTSAPSAAVVRQGTDVTYAITVRNAGPVEATGVTLTDVLPAALSLVSVDTTAGACAGGAAVSCALGTIANGVTVTVTIVATAMETGAIANTATAIAANGLDGNVADNTATASILSAVVDLDVTVTPSASLVLPGGELTYTVTARNRGLTAATGVTVTDVLPAGAVLVSATPSAGTCAGTAPVSCVLDDLAPGATATVAVVVRAGALGPIANTVSVTSVEPDLDPANNTSSAAGLVSAADVALAGTAPGVVGTGGTLTYEFVVRNLGPDAATDVVFSDALPPEVTLVSASAAPGTCTAASPVRCSIGTLASGASATVRLVTRAAIAASVTNNATIQAVEPDPDPGNNTATAATSVGAILEGRLKSNLACPPTAQRGQPVPATASFSNDTPEARHITRGLVLVHAGELNVVGPTLLAASATVPARILLPASCSGCPLVSVPSTETVPVTLGVPANARRGSLVTYMVTFLGRVGEGTVREPLATLQCLIEVTR